MSWYSLRMREIQTTKTPTTDTFYATSMLEILAKIVKGY